MTITDFHSAAYRQALDGVHHLSFEEQLALVKEIMASLRAATHNRNELAEVEYLAQSPTFQRLAERGLREIREGNYRNVEDLLRKL